MPIWYFRSARSYTTLNESHNHLTRKANEENLVAGVSKTLSMVHHARASSNVAQDDDCYALDRCICGASAAVASDEQEQRDQRSERIGYNDHCEQHGGQSEACAGAVLRLLPIHLSRYFSIAFPPSPTNPKLLFSSLLFFSFLHVKTASSIRSPPSRSSSLATFSVAYHINGRMGARGPEAL